MIELFFDSQEYELILQDSDYILEVESAVLVQGHKEEYPGPYRVSPRLSGDVVLPTKDTLMVDNVTIKKIPQYEVANESEGITFIIKEE